MIAVTKLHVVRVECMAEDDSGDRLLAQDALMR